MAEGGGEFGNYDPDLDSAIDNDDIYNEPYEQEVDKTQPFKPTSSSTPYHGGEQHEMQTMLHEPSGLPSYDERTPLLTAEIERRFADLREDPQTGIINTTEMMDASINPLSEEDRAIQIERVKKLIKASYPNAKVDSLVIAFSKKNPMNIVILGPKGGETKVVLNDGSGLQKSFLNLTFVKKALGPPSEQIIEQANVHIIKRQKELEKERDFEKSQQQNLKSKSDEIQNLDERLNKEKAIIEQLKEDQGPEEEIKRKDQLIKNLKKDLKTKKEEREELQKKIKNEEKKQEKIDQLQSSLSQEKRKRNALEENLYSTKTFDALKE